MSRKSLRSVQAIALVSVSAITLSACSGTTKNTSEAKVNLDGQQQLEVPEVKHANMIVPPAYVVPELPVAGNPPATQTPAPAGPTGDGLYPAPTTENVGEQRGNGQPITKGGVGNNFVAKLTGSQSVDHTDTKWGVAGAGNAVNWDNGQGSVITMFGDTFGRPRPQGERSDQPPLVSGAGLNLPVFPKGVPFPALPYVNLVQGGTQGSGFAGDTGTKAPTGFDWRNNTLAYSTTHDLRQFSFDSFATGPNGQARELIGSKKVNDVEITTLPTSGISIGGRQYLAYASIRRYGPAPGSWTSNYAGIAVSDDNGATWRKSKSAFWTNAGPARNFQMLSMAKYGDRVYVFGTEQGRVGGVYVARVKASKLLDKNAYEYWSGGHWTRGLKAEPTPVVSGGVGEVSVMWSPSLRQWLMVATDVFRNGIVLRQANSPVGPWTDARVIASGTNYPSIYGANIHPWSKGNDLYFTMSQWTSYNVYLMHATVTRRPIPGARPGIPEIPLPGGQRLPGGVAPDLPGATFDLQLPKSMQGPGGNSRAPRGPGA